MRITLVSIVLGAAGAAAGQDAVFTVQETTEADRYVVYATFFGSLPAGSTLLDVVWSDVDIVVAGDAPVTFDAWNPGYNNALTGGPTLTGNGTSTARFASTMFGTASVNIIGGPTPDSSNPLLAMTFRYAGSPGALSFQLDGQNSVVFEGNPAAPFGVIQLYQDAQGNPGNRSYREEFAFGEFPADQLNFFVPAPATVALAPVALLAAGRRRR